MQANIHVIQGDRNVSERHSKLEFVPYFCECEQGYDSDEIVLSEP